MSENDLIFETTLPADVLEDLIKKTMKPRIETLEKAIKEIASNQKVIAEALEKLLNIQTEKRKEKLKEAKEKTKPHGIVHAETEPSPLDKHVLERLKRYDLSTPEGVKAYLKEVEGNGNHR